jgi:AmmeMemoRadiSam system protein A
METEGEMMHAVPPANVSGRTVGSDRRIRKRYLMTMIASGTQFHYVRADMIEISEQDSATLIGMARKAITEAVLPRASTVSGVFPPLGLTSHSGIFVTVHVDGRLRGCIGDLDPAASVAEALVHAARSAVSHDYRFASVAPDELLRLSFEITILEPMVPITSEQDLVIGRDGIFIEYLASRGILLPQVAAERQWSPRQFLEAVCEKARLPRGAWRDSHARCFRFGATKLHADFDSAASAGNQ